MSASRRPARVLAYDEVADLSDADLQYAINEMYARHGFTFESVALRRQFLRYSWYKPDPSLTTRRIESRMSRTERANLRTLTDSREGAR